MLVRVRFYESGTLLEKHKICKHLLELSEILKLSISVLAVLHTNEPRFFPRLIEGHKLKIHAKKNRYFYDRKYLLVKKNKSNITLRKFA